MATPKVLAMIAPIAVPAGDGVMMFTMNAPMKMAGHKRTPQISSAAKAMPVGGHTGETLAFSDASESPNLPAQTYTAISATIPASFLMGDAAMRCRIHLRSQCGFENRAVNADIIV
jgi:hypothetical protein